MPLQWLFAAMREAPAAAVAAPAAFAGTACHSHGGKGQGEATCMGTPSALRTYTVFCHPPLPICDECAPPCARDGGTSRCNHIVCRVYESRQDCQGPASHHNPARWLANARMLAQHLAHPVAPPLQSTSTPTTPDQLLPGQPLPLERVPRPARSSRNHQRATRHYLHLLLRHTRPRQAAVAPAFPDWDCAASC